MLRMKLVRQELEEEMHIIRGPVMYAHLQSVKNTPSIGEI